MTYSPIAGMNTSRLPAITPGRVTPRPGDAQRLAEEVLEALSPMVAEAAGDEEDKTKRERAERRAELALLTSGLEILASWYTDSASLQHGGPVRNTDVPLADLTDAELAEISPPG